MPTSSRPRILCVDDESQVVEGLKPHLQRHYIVDIATSGPAGLDLLKRHPDTAVIVSDMRMPGMDGARFLAESRAIAPNARRILLTGHSDVLSAMAAINDGQICRFLTKPCETASFLEAVRFALTEFEGEMADHSAIRRFAAQDVLARDTVTGLASRGRLLDVLTALIAGREGTSKTAGTLYLIDVRLLPGLADELDSGAVDELLRVMSGRLQESARSAACVARWDSRAFAVLDNAAGRSEGDLRTRGLELAEALTWAVTADPASVAVEASVGIVDIPPDLTEPQLVMRHAELAAREARLMGGTSAFVFTAASNSKAEYRRELIRSLRLAIAGDQLELHYQPIVDVSRGQVHSVEALARWTDPHLGRITPATFIPIAESAGLMVPFGNWTLRRACREARMIVDSDCPRVAVNVSVTQLLDAGFLSGLYLALEESRLDPSALELEVTESVFAQDLDQVRSLLLDIKRIGIRIAIDDFGAGYSSLAYLNKLPVDALKTDGIFMREFDTGGDAIVEATLQMARKLGFEAVVEGVETAERLEQVRSIGATLLQGYYFARPMPADALKAWRDHFTTSTASRSTCSPPRCAA